MKPGLQFCLYQSINHFWQKGTLIPLYCQAKISVHQKDIPATVNAAPLCSHVGLESAVKKHFPRLLQLWTAPKIVLPYTQELC
ncbi:hypothetical protein Gbem_4113 [Citrifermentans bemidjiense Bem]|uniref:Uncharacterized protein n=1 Tax=Citrifermentans bemidjiense (strain ATCC BAA-1014 / DSM 16622 / JCM 12645 / Bem) TaxID=404380 RepID=E1P6B6_CITBB|nr:hypothetical protein Gbem_4113 [Citrifermentans bemidjiense Bem]